MYSSSLVASDDSDGDAGLLSALLGPPSFGSAKCTYELSDLFYYTVQLGPLRSVL